MRTLFRILILFLWILPAQTYGQKQWSNWYLNGRSLVTFRNGAPEARTDFSPVPGSFTSFGDMTFAATSDHGISYADPVTGEMKFIVSAISAFDKNYKVIISGEFLRGCSGYAGIRQLIPFPNDPNKFYVVQFQDMSAPILAASTGLQVRCPNPIGLGYSVFDLSLNGGLGNFSSINTVLQGGTALGMQLVRHANGKDVWVLTHDFGNNQFKAYLFTDAGVNAPVVTAIGPNIIAQNTNIDGSFTVSHDGRTLFMARPRNKECYLMDFNNATGTLSNSRRFATGYEMTMPVFSPDDSKLYFYGTYQDAYIYQMDFDAPDLMASITRISDVENDFIYDMALGPDGKIYLSQYNEYDMAADDYLDYLSIVHCPNLPKYASRFEAKGLRVSSGGYFQRFVNDVGKQPKAAPITEFSLGRDTTICFGSYKLSAPSGWQEYTWNTGETTREINVTKAGTYYVLAGGTGASCPSGYGYITIKDASNKLNLGRDTLLCPKQNFSIRIPPNYSNIRWNDGGSESVKSILTDGTYIVNASDATGCATADTIRVSFKSLPAAQFGRDTVLCAGQELLLNMQPSSLFFSNVRYSWSDGSGRDSLRVRTAGTYWGEVSYQGCTARDTIAVSFVDAARFSLGSDTTICRGESLELKTNINNATYQWSTGETSSSVRVSADGNYWVRVNNGSCTVTDTIRVRMQDKPVLDLGPDLSLCTGDTVRLTLNIAGAKYRWQDLSDKNNFLVSTPGKYQVTVDLNGCIHSDSIQVNYRSLPVSILPRDTSFCEQQSLRLDAAHPSVQSYAWQDGSGTSQITVNSAGMYTVKLTGTNGCVNEVGVLVRVGALPQFSLGADTTLCDRQLLNLQPRLPGGTYRWNDGSTGRELAVSRPGTYWLEVLQNGCSKRDSIIVNYKPNPLVNLGRDTTLCEGVTKTLNALYDGASYTWQDQATSARYEVRRAGIYHVAVNLDGCVARDTITVSYRSRPQFSLGADTSICQGNEIMLRPGISNAAYRWQDGSTNADFIVRSEGVYRLTASNACGTTSDEIVVSKGICKLYMPNAFTPNGDGLNDLFRIKDAGFVATMDLKVYNYFGELIFHGTDPRRGWDGTYKGIQQPHGNYVWQITVTTLDGVKEYQKGTVLLIR